MGNLADLYRRSAWDIAQSLGAGEANPVALAEFLLGLAEGQSAAKIYLKITRERALAEAEQSAKRLAEGKPLSAFDGVPIAFKDLFDMKGEVTSAGSAMRKNAQAAKRDAIAVARASAAGMVVLGKLNLTEFAYSGLGLNPHFGTPVNPCDKVKARVPGGSSSGSGVAVVRGLVPIAIGTDTGGSVRVPAAFNGVVGFKPSEGRFDKTGVFALSPTFDTIGPLVRSVQDCIGMDMVLRGRPPHRLEPKPLAGHRVIVPENVVVEGLDAGVAANFERSLRLLERAGARIEYSKFGIFSEVVQLGTDYGSIVGAEAFEQHRQLMESDAGKLVDKRVTARIMAGREVNASNLNYLKRERLRLIGELEASAGDALILMPTTATTAPEIAPLEANESLFHKTNILALRNTSLGNFLNMAGLALPNGVDENSMPTSLLVSATGGRDDALLRFGLEIERLHEVVATAPPHG